MGNFFESFIAKSVFPEAVGPNKKIKGFLLVVFIREHPDLFRLF